MTERIGCRRARGLIVAIAVTELNPNTGIEVVATVRIGDLVHRPRPVQPDVVTIRLRSRDARRIVSCHRRTGSPGGASANGGPYGLTSATTTGETRVHRR